ncbi:GRP family sugar transporter [Pediococcus ethanolidurans]|nr:GRP family sugar transporter [Pediococcus ethanolidurans]
MTILIGLIPAIIWGIMPTILYYVKGSAIEQLLGTTFGTLIVSIIVFVYFKPQINLTTGMFSLVSGIGWSIGQYGQYWAYQRIGVSRTFPISAGLQIIGNTLIGGLVFGEWQGSEQFVFGVIGITTTVVGLIIGNMTRSNKLETDGNSHKIDYLILILTTVGYWSYSAFPKLIQNGNAVAELLPQAVGMTLMASILAVMFNRNTGLHFNKIRLNTLVGTLFGVAAGTYLLSMSLNGLVNAFLLSQMNMVIATLLGTIWLKEKPVVGMLRVFLGLGFIFIGSVVMIVMTE